MVTMKEVAQRAGVSISTVSRVLNRDEKKPASRKTADKIWKIVEELGYEPNFNAVSLTRVNAGESSQKVVKRIGCIFTASRDIMSDSFFSSLNVGIHSEADKLGYAIAFTLAVYEMPFSDIKKYVTRQSVDGIIIMGRVSRKLLDFFKNNYKNLVYAGVNSLDSGIDEVLCDSCKGMAEMAEYVVQCGHRNVGYIGDGMSQSEELIVNEHRYRAFAEVMREKGIAIDKENLIYASPYIEPTYDTVRGYMQGRDKSTLPSIYVCTNDNCAIGAMRAFGEFGVKIPQDVSIVGFDDLDFVKYLTPSLTTINVPKKELGEMAVRTLVDRISAERKYPIRIDLPYSLVIRESCAVASDK